MNVGIQAEIQSNLIDNDGSKCLNSSTQTFIPQDTSSETETSSDRPSTVIVSFFFTSMYLYVIP